MFGRFELACFALTFLASSREAGARDHSLFRPTPQAELRELDPDRPDMTESAHTVDAGHLQIEMEGLLYRAERSEDVITEEWEAATAVVKVGVTDSIDVQVVTESFVVETESHRTKPGAGRIGLRVKANLYDDDDAALAVVPFGEWDGQRADGGLAVPFSIELPAEFKLGLQAEVDLGGTRNPNAIVPELIESATLNRTLVGPLGAFIEVATVEELVHTSASVFTNGGLNWMLSRDVRLDAGGRFEVVGEHHLREFFLGVAARR